MAGDPDVADRLCHLPWRHHGLRISSLDVGLSPAEQAVEPRSRQRRQDVGPAAEGIEQRRASNKTSGRRCYRRPLAFLRPTNETYCGTAKGWPVKIASLT